MALIDIMMQGKGGVGKSYAASLLAQHCLRQGVIPICIDTDPVNATLAGYAAYGTRRLVLMDGDDINPRNFDDLIETVEENSEARIIIDNGASSFVSLLSYFLTNDVPAYLAGAGHQLRFHTVIAGGQSLDDTTLGFEKLCSSFPESRVVVWKNEFFGRLEKNGKSFEDSSLYKNRQNQIDAIVTLKAVKKELFGVDIEQMLKSRLTFHEALASPEFKSMSRQRLKLTWEDISAQLQRAGL